MTIMVELAPSADALLSDLAERNGQDRSAVASVMLTAALEQVAGGREEVATDRVRSALTWSAEFRAKYNIPADAEPLSDEEAGVLTPEEEAEAISVGLDAPFAGRVTPAAEWSARFRARHNIPEGGQSMPPEDARLLP